MVILIFLVIMFVFTRLDELPRSLPFISWFVLIALLGAPRFLYRVVKDQRFDIRLDEDAHPRVPILLVGAGDSAELFIREISRSNSNYRIVGLASNQAARVGRDIHGIEVLGTIDELPLIIENLKKRGNGPQRLVISAERLAKGQLDRLLTVGNELRAQCSSTSFFNQF